MLEITKIYVLIPVIILYDDFKITHMELLLRTYRLLIMRDVCDIIFNCFVFDVVTGGVFGQWLILVMSFVVSPYPCRSLTCAVLYGHTRCFKDYRSLSVQSLPPPP